MQVLTIMYMNLFFFVFVGNIQPFKQLFMNRLNLFNESIILHLTIIMVLFTDFCPWPVAKYNLGWMYVIELTIFLIVNLILISAPSFRIMIMYIKKYSILAWDKIKKL